MALDERDPARAKELADATEAHAGAFKVGLTAFAAIGRDLVSELSQRLPVFLDLKLHDIPVQVGGAVTAIADLGARYTTVHASGGPDMIAAARDAAGDRVAVLGVTILTSLDEPSLSKIGISGGSQDAVLRLAQLAIDAGAHGVVCSPLEVASLRENFGTLDAGGPLLVVPGIRLDGSAPDDQRRTLGPRAAIDAGADIIVVGRAITASADPGAVARVIAEEIA